MKHEYQYYIKLTGASPFHNPTTRSCWMIALTTDDILIGVELLKIKKYHFNLMLLCFL